MVGVNTISSSTLGGMVRIYAQAAHFNSGLRITICTTTQHSAMVIAILYRRIFPDVSVYTLLHQHTYLSGEIILLDKN